jgi:N-acetylmuramoyl-L-alanine amidase
MSLRIIDAPSSNFNDRLHPIDMLVLHYTGMNDGPSALARMREETEPRVSAHYMVEEDGTVFTLVPEEKRAWQAGRSWWRGDEDLNSRSIGIEIVNGGHDFGLPPYPDAQIEAVMELCQGILARWPIPATRVVAHSDIAPDRKEDPGEHFPWKRLAEAGIGIWPPKSVQREPWMMHGAALGDAGVTVEKLQAEIQAQVATLRDEQREDLMIARKELVELFRVLESKVDEGFKSIKVDLAALKSDVDKGFLTLSKDIEQRDMAALANAATLKRNIDALQDMVKKTSLKLLCPAKKIRI